MQDLIPMHSAPLNSSRFRWQKLFAHVRRGLHKLTGQNSARPITTAYGVKIYPDWNDVTSRLYVHGRYGEFLARLLSKRQQPYLFLDIGANQGLYSILAAQNSNCAQVYAFEPHPDTVSRLAENLELNQCSCVTIIPAAISDSCGVAALKANANHSGAATLQQRREDSHSESTHTVEITTIDHTGLNDLNIKADLPIIVKIDVEGHEPEVLEQLFKSRLNRAITDIFYECDERWVDAAAIQRRLQLENFTQFIKVGEGQSYDVLAQRITGRTDLEESDT